LSNYFYSWRQTWQRNRLYCRHRKSIDTNRKKSGKTYTKDYFKNINYWNKLSNSHATDSYLIYNGDNNETLLNGHLISWNNLDEIPLE
jgi:hypothetical protein